MFICTLREREVETGVLWALSFEKFLFFAAIMTGSSRKLLTEQALPGVGSTDVIPPQSTGTLPPYDPYNFGYRFNISMAIVVVVIIAAFLFLGFILFYLRNRWSMERRIFFLQQQRQVDPSRLANRHGLDRGMVENFPLMRCGSAKAANAGRGSMDCSVCLTEFEDDEKLRILPNCGHGFHPDCIDMWLLSHSTCPLCRISLVPSTCDHIAIATPSLQTFDATLPEAQAAAAAAAACGNDLQNLSETREDSSLVERLAVRALSRNSESFRKAAQVAELLCADEGDGSNSSRRWKIMRARFTEPQQQICNCTTEENRDANLQKSRNMETESAFDDQSESYHVNALDTYTRDGSRSMATDQEQFSVAKSNSLLDNEEGHQARRNEETGWVSINLDAATEHSLPLHNSHHFQIQSENH